MRFNFTSYGRRGPTHRDRFSPAEIALISRTARRVPEVMVKGPEARRGVTAHFDYIGREGDLEIETDDGERLSLDQADECRRCIGVSPLNSVGRTCLS